MAKLTEEQSAKASEWESRRHQFKNAAAGNPTADSWAQKREQFLASQSEQQQASSPAESNIQYEPQYISQGMKDAPEQAARGLANIPFDILQGGANLINAGTSAVGLGNVLDPVYRPVDRPTDPWAQAGEAIGTYLVPGAGAVKGAMIGSVANAGNQPGDFAENATKEMAINTAMMGAPALYRGARQLIRGGEPAAERVAQQATQQAAPNVENQAEEALRRVAARDNPDLASSLQGLDVRPQQDVAEAAGRLGVDSILPSHLSGNAQYQAVEQAIKSRAGSALRVQEDQAISELASGAGKIIDDVAGAPDALAMSDRFIGQVNGRMAALERRSDSLYSRVDKAMAPGTRIEAPSTGAMLEREADSLGGWENLDTIEQRVFKAVNPGENGVLTYANLNKQRRLVGQALNKNSGPYKDADRAALSRLYATLSDDQRLALGNTGALRDFEVAQRLVQMRKTMEEQMVNLRGRTLNGDVAATATTALQSMAKGNGKAFRDLMDSTPSRQLRTELVGTALRDMLSSGKRGADFNPAGFADWWQNMQASGQIRLLSQHLPKETMAGLRDAYTVARAIKNAKAYEITTGRLNEFTSRFNRVTAPYEMAASHAQRIGTMVGAYGGPLGAIAGAEIGQRLAQKARIAGGAGSMEAADRLIASPEFQRAIKSLPATAPGHVMDSRVRQSPQWRTFFDSLPEIDKKTIARLGVVGWLNHQRQDSENQ